MGPSGIGRSSGTRRRRAGRTLAALAVLALVAGLGTGSGVAYADPDDSLPSKDEIEKAERRADSVADTVGEVRAQLAAANQRLRDLDVRFQTSAEEYNAARYELQRAERAATAAEQQATSAHQALEEQRDKIGQFAARTYRQQGGLTDLSAMLAADDPQALIDRATSARQIADAAAADHETLRARRAVSSVLDRQAERAVDARQAAARAAEEAKAEAERQLATQQQAVAEVEREKRAHLARLADLQSVSVELAEKRQAGLEKRARERAEAEREKAERQKDKDSGEGDPSDPSDPTTGEGRIAVQFALAQLGEPYVFGAAGPGTWDCSGLTLRAWEQAGVLMPHFARGQYWQSKRISLGELRPGDLIYWASDPTDSNTIHHVGMYIGDGQMVHAPRPGRTVELQSMWYMGTPTHYARPQ